MLDTEPPGKPFSGTQKSCKYCDKARFASFADAGTTKHAKANPTMAHRESQGLRKTCSRKIFKLLNYHLARSLQRALVACDDEKYQSELCLSWRWYVRGELMFRDRSARASCPSPGDLESRTSRFPAHRIRESACGESECEQVPWIVERLHCILRVVLSRGVTPAADLDVHFTIMLFG